MNKTTIPETPALKRKPLWESLFIVVLWFAAVLWLFKSMGKLRSFADIVSASSHLDVGWYQTIAEHGYSVEPSYTHGQSTVFFPLFPLLAPVFVHVASLDSLLSLHLVQKIGLVVMSFFVFRWCSTEGFAAKESLIALLVHPAWVFLFVPYSETIYLCCLFGLLIAWQQKNAFAFFVGAFLLGLCRPTGLFLVPAAGLTLVCLFIGYLKSRHIYTSESDNSPNTFPKQFFSTKEIFADPTRKQAVIVLCAGIAGSGAALAVIALVMHFSVGDWYAFYRYRSLWKEEPSLRHFLTALNLNFGSQTPRVLAIWGALWGCVLLVRSGRVFEGFLCGFSILLPIYQGKMTDIIRYTLGAAPAWIMLAERLKERRSLHLAFVAASSAYGVVLCYKWLLRDWVG